MYRCKLNSFSIFLISRYKSRRDLISVALEFCKKWNAVRYSMIVLCNTYGIEILISFNIYRYSLPTAIVLNSDNYQNKINSRFHHFHNHQRQSASKTVYTNCFYFVTLRALCVPILCIGITLLLFPITVLT